ncbi:MAG: hypothetical protein HFG74_06790 [Hungatella sp.]|nr:hypothetical protein [Hungatella sp.]
MTHVYAYIKEGCEREQIRDLVAGIKKAVGEGFGLDAPASTVVVKELAGDCHSDNFGALALVYTAAGKGLDVKKRFARLLYEAFAPIPGAGENLQMVIKEQADDMSGLNGLLRCASRQAATACEMG